MIATIVWILWLITFNPYSKTPVAGPFYLYAECAQVQSASVAPTGAYYSCQSQYVP